MAGIEHHHGLGVGGTRCGLRDRRRGRRLGFRRLRFFQLGEEGLLVGRHEVDHEACGLVVARLEHEGLVDEKGPGHVDDDARFARREQSVAVSGDKAPLLLADPVGHLEVHIGRIDDDAIGIAEGEDVHVDLLRQIGDEARALPVAGNARVVGDGGLRLGLGRQDRKAGPIRATKGDGQCRRDRSQGTLELASSPT